jgi:NifB/MoaA-like Fe-S oxidoreductase
MNDELEQAHYDKDELKETKAEVEILIDHYVSQLQHATNPDTRQAIKMRLENKNKEHAELVEAIRKKAEFILEFNNN